MKKISLLFVLFFAIAFSVVNAQNGQSAFSQVAIYDNQNGTATVELKLTPNGQGMVVRDMTISGDRVHGTMTLTNNSRVSPFTMTSSTQGNGNATILVVTFPVTESTENGGESLLLQVNYDRRVGDHLVQDSFAVEHTIRRR
jgi:hypothetical protein